MTKSKFCSIFNGLTAMIIISWTWDNMMKRRKYCFLMARDLRFNLSKRKKTKKMRTL
jgi:hypothetical protein